MNRPDYQADRFRRLTVPSKDGAGTARVTWVSPGDRMDPWRPGGYADSLWASGNRAEADDLGPIGKYSSQAKMDAYLADRGDSRKWFGTTNAGKAFRSWEDVLQLFTEGWDGGRNMLQANRAEILQAFPESLGLAQGRRRVRRYGADGDVYNPEHRGDMDRAWISRKRISRGYGPIVSIAFKSGFNCNQTPQAAAWVPVAPLVLAQALEEAGYSVELVAMNVVKHGDARNWKSVEIIPMRLKGSDEPFRLNGLTAMMHPVAHRTVGFQELCLSDTPEDICWSLGQAWSNADGSLPDKYDLTKFGFEGKPVYIPQAFTLVQATYAINEGMKQLA